MGVEDTCVPSGGIPPCLYIHHHCALILRQMKIVGVVAGTSTKIVLIMWPNSMEMNIKIFLGLAPWMTLYQIPTRSYICNTHLWVQPWIKCLDMEQEAHWIIMTWSDTLTEKIQIPQDILLWRTLEQSPTRM